MAKMQNGQEDRRRDLPLGVRFYVTPKKCFENRLMNRGCEDACGALGSCGKQLSILTMRAEVKQCANRKFSSVQSSLHVGIHVRAVFGVNEFDTAMPILTNAVAQRCGEHGSWQHHRKNKSRQKPNTPRLAANNLVLHRFYADLRATIGA